MRPSTLHCVAHLDALRGRAEQARVRLDRAREVNLAHGMVANNYQVEAILGHLELSVGRLPEAVTALEVAQAIYEGRGGEPALFRSTPDPVEALVHLRQVYGPKGSWIGTHGSPTPRDAASAGPR